MSKTLFAKIWDDHVVHQEPGRPDLLYIDRHLVQEAGTAASRSSRSASTTAGRSSRCWTDLAPRLVFTNNASLFSC